jgi:cation diffusion facilitator family transporter
LDRKVIAARLSVGSNLLLVVGKLIVGLASGSVSVLSEAVHSAVDLVAALISLFSVQASNVPADDDHQFGHGKIENLSALIEGILVLVAAAYICFEAVRKLQGHRGVPSSVSLGLWVMGISALVNAMVSQYLLKVAKEEESMALAADAIHLRSDVYTSLGVFVGLLLVKFTGIALLDPIVAILVAGMIVRAGWELCRSALAPLVDARLPATEEHAIIELIEQHSDEFVEFHGLRTRRSGAERHIDFHLVVHGRMELQAVHALCDEIETAILAIYPRSYVLIHPEPCGPTCDLCHGQRTIRRRLEAEPRRKPKK